MNTPNNTTLSFDEMHDATLFSITVDWANGELYCAFTGRNEVMLLASGLTLLHCPRTFAWGKSVSVNKMSLSDVGAAQALRIEMQSGDIIEATVKHANLTLTRAT